MVFAGIDCGTRNVKAVLFDGKDIVGEARAFTDWNPPVAAAQALSDALRQAGLDERDVTASASTGNGRRDVADAYDYSLSGINAAAAGALFLVPEAKRVIDLGAEGIAVISIADDGTVGNFVLNDRCANGAGAFLESMGRILEVPVDQLGDLSRASTQDVTMDTQCVVFAESEVISMIHHQIPKEDIVHAVHTDLAHKIGQYCYKLGLEDPMALIGAAAADYGLVDVMEDNLGVRIVVPGECEFASALGAALYAQAEHAKEAE